MMVKTMITSDGDDLLLDPDDVASNDVWMGLVSGEEGGIVDGEMGACSDGWRLWWIRSHGGELWEALRRPWK